MQVTIAVGGVREVCLGTSDDVDLLYLKKRYEGFPTEVLSAHNSFSETYLQIFLNDASCSCAW